jgi:uncharacterized protein YjiS (DUF1127 family)
MSSDQPTAARDVRSLFTIWLWDLRNRIDRALHNHRTRRELMEIDDCTLADLGISRAQARFEASRWMWD